MKAASLKRTWGWLLFCVVAAGCERDFDINLRDGQPQLIVEAYINNEMPLYNYVVLSRSKEFYESGLQNVAVSGAVVTITEGERLSDKTYRWDDASVTYMKEGRLDQLNNASLPGFYFDERLTTDSVHALLGKPGKSYRLDIETEGKKYSAITELLVPVAVDSLTLGNYFIDRNTDTVYLKARITVHYKDPDTIGNTQLFYWRHWDNRRSFGWGALSTNRYTPGTDDLTNGQYINLTLPNGFAVGDTVNFYMTSVERKVYNFWDSFNKARENNGPFATPVALSSTVNGENVVGCFSGFSVSSMTIPIR